MLEEVGDLRFQQLWQVVHIFNVIVLFAQLGVRYGNQFRIFTRFVSHFQHANRTAANDGAPAAMDMALGPVRQPGHRPETECG